MIGVVLWSDSNAEKAVIWCEDNGDLAFLSRADATVLPDTFVDIGDVVEFDLRAQRNTRRATNIKILSEARGTVLVNELKSDPFAQRLDAKGTAEVIPFRLEPPVRRSPTPPRARRRG